MRLGPRNRRRLAIGGGISLAAGIAAAAVVLFTGSTSHPKLAQPPSRQLVALIDKIIDGMSKQQVLRAVGKPASSRGRCW